METLCGLWDQTSAFLLLRALQVTPQSLQLAEGAFHDHGGAILERHPSLLTLCLASWAVNSLPPPGEGFPTSFHASVYA